MPTLRGVAAQAALASLMLAAAGRCAGQEIAAFRLTGIEGYFLTRYVRDESVAAQPGAGSARGRDQQSDLRAELFIMTHSYAYHPKLVTFDVGAGPILERAGSSTDAQSTTSTQTLYNLTARAVVLADKPYRGSVFYDHLNPIVTVAPGIVLTQENTRYGVDFALLPPLVPLAITGDATHTHTRARGAGIVVDDQTERFNLRASRAFGALGDTQAFLQVARQDSLGGSVNLPIQRSISTNRSLAVDTRLYFGERRDFDVVNTILLGSQSFTLQQSAVPDRRDLRITLEGRARKPAELQSFAALTHTTSDQGTLAAVADAASAGVVYQPRIDLVASANVRGDDTRFGAVSTRTRGVDGSIQYQRELPLGKLHAGYGVRHERRDQRSSSSQNQVIGERVTLTGTMFATIARQRVIESSVVVSNAARTQTFVEGADYALAVVGLETRIQRLVTGEILDGQEVLVDYTYDTGGTYAYVETDRNWNLSWALANIATIYYRGLDAAPELTSGTPTFGLNTVHSALYGARADIPVTLPFEFLVGGGLEREERRETISPYRRTAQDLYLQAEDRWLGLGAVRISARRARQDYQNSGQNVNLKAYDLRYVVRTGVGLEVAADASYELDTGTLNPRRRTGASLKARWLFRRLTCTLDLMRSNESQAGTERTRANVQFLVRRDF